MKRVYIILKEDIIDFPPVLSIIEILTRHQYKVVHLGTYTDIYQKKKFEQNGAEFVSMPQYDGNASIFKKLYQQLKFKKDVIKYFKRNEVSDDDFLWLIQAETIYLLSSLVKKHKTILHPLEFIEPKVNWKYRILNLSINLTKTMQQSYRVVCCEYNRAQICKGIFQLNELPIILPNKIADLNDDNSDNVPADIFSLIQNIKEKTANKKVILYQGIFLDEERRLEEFCEATNDLPQDFVFIAMGRGSEMYERLKKKYESERIIFIPFIRPPFHLLITQMASIGVLSYFPRPGSIGRTLNPLYCAPNKIFEYSKFGIPMISNDVPALKYAYLEYHCGECIEYPMTKEAISRTIKKIFDHYHSYSDGALRYYESVDSKKIILSIVN